MTRVQLLPVHSELVIVHVPDSSPHLYASLIRLSPAPEHDASMLQEAVARKSSCDGCLGGAKDARRTALAIV